MSSGLAHQIHRWDDYPNHAADEALSHEARHKEFLQDNDEHSFQPSAFTPPIFCLEKSDTVEVFVDDTFVHIRSATSCTIVCYLYYICIIIFDVLYCMYNTHVSYDSHLFMNSQLASPLSSFRFYIFVYIYTVLSKPRALRLP